MAHARRTTNRYESIDPKNVDSQFLATVLGVTPTAVSQLRKRQVITGNGRRGKYDLTEVVPRYLESIRTGGTAEASELLKIAQRRKLDIANDKAEGQLVSVTDVATLLNIAATNFLTCWGSIPRRVAVELSKANSAKVCREILEIESDSAREQFAAPIIQYFIDSGQELPDCLTETLSDTDGSFGKPRLIVKRKRNKAK
ncbi:MAG: hypothetical protein HOM16_13815 [Woeseia sp.]|jgi:hypothetical protein|nr:hypothetical protein [Woeseia sp.]